MRKFTWEKIAQRNISVFHWYFYFEGYVEKYPIILGGKYRHRFTEITKNVSVLYAPEDEKIDEGPFRKKIYQKIKRDKKFITQHLKKCLQNGKDLVDLSEKIKKSKLSQKTNKEVLKIFLEYWEKFRETIIHAMPIVGRVLSEILINEYLWKKLSRKEVKNLGYFLNLLSIPQEFTLMKKDEIGLLKLVLKISKRPKTARLFLKKKFKELIKKLPLLGPEIDKLIGQHLAKYGYLYMGFDGKPKNKNDYLKELAITLKRGDYQKTLKNIERQQKEVRLKQKILIKRLKFSPEAEKLVKNLQECAYFQTYSDNMASLAIYNVQNLYQEIARRMGLKTKEAKFLIPPEIKYLLEKNKKADPKLIKKRKICTLFFLKDGGFEIIEGKRAKEKAGNLLKAIPATRKKEARGIPASWGKAIGRVKVILRINKKEIKKFRKGNILITSMTSVDFVPLMRKAKAVVTDEGGLTSHAAIISREFGIPCVIGTKVATKVFHDGQKVEVDADEGRIRILD